MVGGYALTLPDTQKPNSGHSGGRIIFDRCINLHPLDRRAVCELIRLQRQVNARSLVKRSVFDVSRLDVSRPPIWHVKSTKTGFSQRPEPFSMSRFLRGVLCRSVEKRNAQQENKNIQKKSTSIQMCALSFLMDFLQLSPSICGQAPV